VLLLLLRSRITSRKILEDGPMRSATNTVFVHTVRLPKDIELTMCQAVIRVNGVAWFACGAARKQEFKRLL
jgi:hypothetical protein